jgi:hypothetical protein
MQRALQRRITPLHSELFDHTWKTRFSNEQNPVISLRAMGRKTSATGFSSVPTPNTPSGGPNSVSTAKHTGGMDLDGCATLAAVPTPMDGTPAQNGNNAAGNTDYSRRIVELASVASPSAQGSAGEISEDLERRGEKWVNRKTGRVLQTNLATDVKMLAPVATPRSEDSQCAGAHRGLPDTLHSQANLQAVTTPSSRDWKDASGMSESGVDPDGSTRTRLDQLPRQAQLAASGPTATGGSVATENTGQLDPAYSRWLMGVPPEWDGFACTATQSVSQRRRSSSNRTGK